MDHAKMKPGSRAKIQEELVRLYLRLNGFFVTGFIAHSDVRGSVLTEIDTLAVRHRYHEEQERQVEPDQVLYLSANHTDLVICEVKGDPAKGFNDALIRNPEVIDKALRWSGFFPPGDVYELAARLHGELLRCPLSSSGPPCIASSREQVRIRCLMFRPEMERDSTTAWFVSRSDLFDYAYRCFCPDTERTTCSTRYNFGHWGDLDIIVRYFKGRAGQGPGKIDDLYKHCAEVSAGK